MLLELYQPSKLKCDLKYEESGREDDSMYHILDNAIEEAWAVSAELLQAGMPAVKPLRPEIWLIHVKG